LAPSTVKLKAAPPAFTAAGAIAVTAGAGLLTAGGDDAPVPSGVDVGAGAGAVDVVAADVAVDVVVVDVVAADVVAADVVTEGVVETGVVDADAVLVAPAAVAAPPPADCTSTPPQPERIVSTPQAAKNRGRSTAKILSGRCHVVAA